LTIWISDVAEKGNLPSLHCYEPLGGINARCIDCIERKKKENKTKKLPLYVTLAMNLWEI
jgi:hypothetical protein